jgi:hypothetical protein
VLGHLVQTTASRWSVAQLAAARWLSGPDQSRTASSDEIAVSCCQSLLLCGRASRSAGRDEVVAGDEEPISPSVTIEYSSSLVCRCGGARAPTGSGVLYDGHPRRWCPRPTA